MLIANGKPEIALLGVVVNFPVVQTDDRLGIVLEQGGIEQDRLAIEVAVVVSPEAAANALETAPANQVAGRGLDGVMGIANVALADPRLSPGGRQELHRPLGIGNRDAINAAHPGFHQVDRRQHFPVNAGGRLRFAVVGEKLGKGFRRNNPPGRDPRGAALAHGEKGAPRGQMPLRDGTPTGGELLDHRCAALPISRQHPIDHLLLVPQIR